MKKEVGASAGFLALLALLMHTQFTGERESGGAARRAAPAEKRDNMDPPEGQRPREGPWLATREFFLKGEARKGDPRKDDGKGVCPGEPDGGVPCLIDPGSKPNRVKLRDFLGAPKDFEEHFNSWSIVATVADPVHTRLSLFFDRQVDAIQNALHAEEWDLAGQWMPWTNEEGRFETDPLKLRRQRHMWRDQEEMPGVLIFRRFNDPKKLKAGEKSDEVLFVFLVPERPTNGVSGPPFYAALQLAHALSKTGQIGFLTPSFSGSFSSLTRLVTEWNSNSVVGDHIPGGRTFYGGTVSSSDEARSFRNRTQLNFMSGIATSAENDDVFCEVLNSYGIESDDVAFLTEDDTAFARHDERSPKDDPSVESCAKMGPIDHYVFPRDISHLRNVYQQEVSAPSKGPPEPGVTFSIQDPTHGEDSVPAYSGLQTPVSQNAILESILDNLRRRRTRIVRIVATNVLDTLFLAQVIRRRVPDIRVLTEDGDFLFVAAGAQTRLTGAIFLSTYPMFFEGDRWVRQDKSKLMFSSPDFRGLYHATRELLQGLHASREETPIESGPSRLWVLTLGRSGFLPVQAFDLPRADPANPDHPGKPTPAKFNPDPALPRPPLGWFLSAAAMTAFIGWGCWLVCRCNRGPEAKWPYWLRVPFGKERARRRLVALIAAGFALNAIEDVLFLPIAISHFDPSWWWRYLAVAPGLVGWLPVGIAGWLMKKELGSYKPAACLFFPLVTANLPWSWLCFVQDNPAAMFFRFRALELFSGASPALPILLLGLAIVVGALSYARRFAHDKDAHPHLELTEIKAASLQSCYKTIDTQIECAWCPRRIWVLVSLALLLIGFLLTKPHLSAPLEHFAFNWTVALIVSVILCYLALACFDLWAIWQQFRRFLLLVDMLPIAGAFRRIGRHRSHRPIWASNNHSSMSPQMLAALEIRSELAWDGVKDLDEYQYALLRSLEFSDEESLSACSSEHAVIVEDAKKPAGELPLRRDHYEKICTALTAQLLSDDLAPVWTHSPEEAPRAPRSLAPGQQRRRCASDFVAIQFSRYIDYCVRSVQWLAWCISACLLLLTLALNSYNPQAPQLLSRFLLAIFIAIGIVVYRVFSGMERDAVLSRLADSNPGELNQEFWLRLAGMGILPFLAVLTHIFPEISGFVSSWVTPNVESLH
jgi:hypothetical protein